VANGIEHGGDPDRVANELYWGSSRSVNRIADDLGLSKGGLYSAIEPQPSGSLCPDCERPLVYENRTARDRGEEHCPLCDQGFRDLDSADLHALPAAPRAKPGSGTAAASQESASVHPPRRTPAAPSGQLLAGTACLALGTGLLLTRWLRGR